MPRNALCRHTPIRHGYQAATHEAEAMTMKCICSLHSRYTPRIEVCLQCALRGTAGTLQFDLGKGYDMGGHANSQVFSYWRAIDEGESYDKDKITALHSWLEYLRY